MSTTWHCHFEINTLLAMRDRQLADIISEPKDVDQARAELRALKEDGKTYLVVGACGSQKPDGSCAGHPTEEGQGGAA